MLRNYFKIAIRNLWKHKTFTVTNIIGLAIAFGATLLLSQTAFHELSFDQLVHATRFGDYGNSILRYKEHQFRYDMEAVDSDFLEMFTFPPEEGDSNKALTSPAGIILTRKVKRLKQPGPIPLIT